LAAQFDSCPIPSLNIYVVFRGKLECVNVTNVAQSGVFATFEKNCAVFAATQQIPTRGSRFFGITEKP